MQMQMQMQVKLSEVLESFTVGERREERDYMH